MISNSCKEVDWSRQCQMNYWSPGGLAFSLFHYDVNQYNKFWSFMYSIDYISFSIAGKTTTLDFCHEIFPLLSIFKNSQILRQKLPVWLSFVKRNGDQESGVCGNLWPTNKWIINLPGSFLTFLNAHFTIGIHSSYHF